MTSEYLLDAVGLIDDDLIREAEEPLSARTPAPVLWLRRWRPSLAACLAVAVALGWMFTYGGIESSMNGSGGAPNAGAAGEAMGSSAADGATGGGVGAPEQPASSGAPQAPAQGPVGSASSSAEEEIPSGTVFAGDDTYSLTRYVEELPEGAALAGKLSEVYPDAPTPSTSVKEYAGLELWLSADGERAYVELPGGGYAEAELVQP